MIGGYVYISVAYPLSSLAGGRENCLFVLKEVRQIPYVLCNEYHAYSLTLPCKFVVMENRCTYAMTPSVLTPSGSCQLPVLLRLCPVRASPVSLSPSLSLSLPLSPSLSLSLSLPLPRSIGSSVGRITLLDPEGSEFDPGLGHN